MCRKSYRFSSHKSWLESTDAVSLHILLHAALNTLFVMAMHIIEVPAACSSIISLLLLAARFSTVVVILAYYTLHIHC